MKYVINVCIIFLFTIGCYHSDNNHWGLKQQDLALKDHKKTIEKNDSIQEILVLPHSGKQEEIDLSQLIDTSFSIRLESNKNCLIGNIDNLLLFNNEIFILDEKISKTVLVFDMNGKFIRGIGKSGKGPGEYPYPECFDIDKINNEILISNSQLRKIIRYNIQGKYLGDIKPEIGHYDFKVLDNNLIVLLAGDHVNAQLGELKDRIIYLIDRKGKIISYGPLNDPGLRNIKVTRSNNLMVKNTDISFSYKLSSTIFSVNQDQIIALFNLNFGNNGLDYDQLKGKGTQEFNNIVHNSNSSPLIFKGCHFQTSNYLYFEYIQGRRVYPSFYNKTQSMLINGKIKQSEEYYLALPFITSHDEYFISAINANSLIDCDIIYQKHTPKTHKSLLKLLGENEDINLSKMDNPVLFFYKFKEKYIEN